MLKISSLLCSHCHGDIRNFDNESWSTKTIYCPYCGKKIKLLVPLYGYGCAEKAETNLLNSNLLIPAHITQSIAYNDD